MRPVRLTLFCLCLALTAGAHAQLATSFYNVTGIQTRVLPNAVQVTIRTDGAVTFGGDPSEFIDIQANQYRPRPVTSLRLRLLRARARLPSFINIGAYPVDSAVVSLGNDDLSLPYFGPNVWMRPSDPRVDIHVRFFVPVTVQQFIVDQQARDPGADEEDGETGITFKGSLGPLEVRVEIGRDRRSILLTVISDRADAGRAARIQRSPPESRKHRLDVTPAGPDKFRVDALHAPLPDVLARFAEASGRQVVSRADAATVDVSLLLPAVSPEEFLQILATAYGLVVLPRSDEAGGGDEVGRDGPASVTERLSLRHLSPERARLLFPDFLLPFLRADRENNGLIVSGSPELIARLRRDLERLDQPRPQVRVEVTAWELDSAEEVRTAPQAAASNGHERWSLSPDTGEMSLRIEEGQVRALSSALAALSERGRARLAARPTLVVASGEEGTLFLGQQRYLTVLQQQFGEQVARALRLAVGTSLRVAPTVGAAGDITLDLTPRLSTVDSVEKGTGLPTLSIRETETVVRVRGGEAVLVAGLDSLLDTRTRRRFGPIGRIPMAGPLFDARRKSGNQTSLILLVTAQKVDL